MLLCAINAVRRTLDDLIAYLRAAIPKMRDTSIQDLDGDFVFSDWLIKTVRATAYELVVGVPVALAVVQEIKLARAYLAIVRVRLGDRLSFSIDVPDRIGKARMPPMMLLPLIDHAIVHGLEQAKTEGGIRITAGASDGRLRLGIIDSSAAFVSEASGDSIASIRERLAALYGNDASLVLRAREDGATEAAMEIPYSTAESDAR